MDAQHDNKPPIVGPTAKWREIMGNVEQINAKVEVYKDFKLVNIDDRLNIFHPDGTRLISMKNRDQAIDFVDTYTNPNINW